MSEVIVRMEMPKNCHECEAKCVSALYGRICGMTRKNIMPFLDKPNRPDWCPIKGEISDIELMHLEEERAFAARNSAAESEADAYYQASVLMQEYFERYEPTYNSEDGSM